MALHQHGSNNPLGIDRRGPQDSIPFHPYYTVKDMFGLCVFLLFFAIFVFYAPNLLGDPDNYIPANPMVTPTAHRAGMVFPAVLRDPALDHLRCARHPGKLLGVVLMFGVGADPVPRALARHLAGAQRPVPADLPHRLLDSGDRRDRARLCRQPAAAGLRSSRSARSPPAYYFIHFLILMPLIGKIETPRPLPLSIGAAVLGPGAARPAHAAQAERA